MPLLLTVTGSAPSALKGILEYRAGGDSHSNANQVVGDADRLLRSADVTHAVVEYADGKTLNIFGDHLLAQIGPQRSIHRAMRVRCRTKGEWHLLHLGHWNDIAKD